MESSSFIANRTLTRNIRAYWILIAVISVFMGYYSYVKFSELYTKSNLINDQVSTLSSLETTLSSEESEYKKLLQEKKDFYETLDGEINNILPQGENYTNLTREMDAFFLGLSKNSNPIFVSNLQYGTPRTDDSKEFGVLPITLTIESSKDNFFKFLDHIENSGSLTSKVRLMDVQSIRINFQKDVTESAKGVDSVSLSVGLNAYFQVDPNFAATTEEANN